METRNEAEKPRGLPEGEFAIVELFGHQTLVGRISEVERFGAKMMALEALYNGELLPPVFHGGASIYRLTPIPKDQALKMQHSEEWTLPVPMRALVPVAELPAPEQNGVADPLGSANPESHDYLGFYHTSRVA